MQILEATTKQLNVMGGEEETVHGFKKRPSKLKDELSKAKDDVPMNSTEETFRENTRLTVITVD